MKFLWALLISAICFGQATLTFKPMLDGHRLQLSPSVKNATTVSVLKFYVSNPVFYLNGKPAFQCPECVYLVDAADEKSLTQTIDIPADAAFDTIAITLGIDEKTNDAGPGEGVLDPVHGMYWSWQSGYINLKIEGSRSGAPFTFHLGGFQKPFAAWRKVILPPKGRNVEILVDVSEFLSAIPKDETTVMSPGEKAMQLSDLAPKMFRL